VNSILGPKWEALKNFSTPPIRAAKTHEVNIRCVTHLKTAFAGRKLVELTADAIEGYLRDRLEQRVRARFKGGYREISSRRRCTRSFGCLGAC
jgi:hypothetical protein